MPIISLQYPHEHLYKHTAFNVFVLHRGVAIKLRDRLGRTPFDVAIESGNGACANLLHKVLKKEILKKSMGDVS